MGIEIERKYLVRSDAWRPSETGKYYRQGYLSQDPHITLRVRIVGKDPTSGSEHRAYLTIKGMVEDLIRPEFEYEIPVQDATEMLNLWCGANVIEKYRYRLLRGNLVWEVDEFLGDNHGLVIAEVELTSREQAVDLPDWIGQEVSGDIRYYNSYLVQYPYSTWRNP